MKHIIIKPILVLLFIFIGFSYLYWNGVYGALDFSNTQEKLFVIEKGESLFKIGENLENENLIKNKILFNLYVFFTLSQGKLQAGGYYLSPSLNISQIAKIIISGTIAKEVITIPEGWNLRDIAWYFENKGMFRAEELFELAGLPALDASLPVDFPKPKNFSSQYDFLKDKPNNLGLEGYLFPDTYNVNWGDSLEEIIIKMLDNFDKKLTEELMIEIKRQGKRIFEIINMASLLEKEVKTIEDKKIVSGILWKRLESGMPLQVDATLSYVTGKRTTRISIEETQIDSPYNTYKYKGLPLGPICNPGIESIRAAVYPEDSGYWFYLSTPKGETIFSRNLEEHNIAKAKYLK
jgi:UPF0755 protein